MFAPSAECLGLSVMDVKCSGLGFVRDDEGLLW